MNNTENISNVEVVNMPLSDRMKEYENETRFYLKKKKPVLIRIDGKAFHTYTNSFEKPFDEFITKSMQETMKFLCENIQGCVLGYTQSDEITLLLVDYNNKNTDAWFGYNVQKMASVASSMATLSFNKIIKNLISNNDEIDDAKREILLNKDAMFDARVFQLPITEVVNCFIWRQRDAIRNSIQAVGYYVFSHKETMGIKTSELIEKLKNEKNIDWNKLPLTLQRGSCCIRDVETKMWTIDNNIPIFSNNKEYIKNLFFIGEYNNKFKEGDIVKITHLAISGIITSVIEIDYEWYYNIKKITDMGNMIALPSDNEYLYEIPERNIIY